MKNYIIGLCLVLGLMSGMAHASVEWGGQTYDSCEASPDPYQCERDTEGQTIIERGTVKTADFLREVEEFNLRMQYYLRPFEEKDLSFSQWMDLYGYGTSGRGVIPGGEFKLPDAKLFGNVGANTDLRAYILNILQWVLSFLGIIAIAVIIFAGYTYIVGGEENNEKAKKMILYAAIGILVILSSYALVNTLITKTLEGGDNFETVQNYISTDDVVSGGSVEATCTTPEGEDCAHSMGIGGWAIDPYNDVTFSLVGVDNQQKVQWNFGDGALYPGENVTGSVTRSFSDSDKWYSVAVMGELQTDEGIKKFVGQSRVWIGDVAHASFKMVPPRKVKAGQEVEFNASGSSVVAGSLDRYVWSCDGECGDFEESSMATSTHGKKQFFHTFDEEGTANISLSVVAKFGAAGEIVSAPFDMEALVQGSMEMVDSRSIDFDLPKKAVKGGNTSFVAKGDMEYEYEWEFPSDDFVTTGKIVTHEFEQAGAQEVILTGLDEEEEVASVAKVLVVGSVGMPVAVARVNDEFVIATRSVEVKKGDPIDIISDSCDEEQVCGEEAAVDVSWSWNSNPVLPAHLEEISSIAGEHSLEMTVTSKNDASKSDKESFKIIVMDDGPDVDLAITPEQALGEGFYRVKVVVGGDDKAVSRYRFEVLEFGKVVDSQSIDSNKKDIQVIMDLSRFEGKHNYTFQVEVTDTDGIKTKEAMEQLVTISGDASTNSAPVAEIFVTPGNAGDTSTSFKFFTRSSDEDGDNLTYTWSLPGGKKVNGKSAVHRFATAGEHVVKVEVSDGIASVSDMVVIRVTDDGSPTSHGDNRAPQVQISGMNPGNTGDTDTKFSFYSNVKDLDMDELVYTWDFGDGKGSSIKNVVHSYDYPGSYQVSLSVSDGIASTEDTINVRVVAAGEDIPESTLPSYDVPESTLSNNDPASHSSALTSDSVSIISGAVNLESFSDEMGRVQEEKQEAIDELSAVIAAKEIQLANCDSTVEDCEKLKQEIDALKEDKNKMEEEVEMLDLVQAKIDALADESDPARQKQLNDEINDLLARLHESDPSFDYDLSTIRGGTDTTFFLYGQIDFETDRPLWMEWDTGDGRTFGGQDVSWKYAESGLYDVVMTVSDGVETVTSSLTIKVE